MIETLTKRSVGMYRYHHTGFNRQITLAEVLVQSGLLSQSQITQVQNIASRLGSPFVALLLDQQMTSPAMLYSILCQAVDLPVLESNAEIETTALRLVHEQQANRYRLLPFAIEDGTMHVAMADPLDAQVIEELEYSTGYRIQPVIGRADKIAELSRTHYNRVITRVIKRLPTQNINPLETQLDIAPQSIDPTVEERIEALVSLLVKKGAFEQQEYDELLQELVTVKDD
jgi:hypothetical protein